MSRHLLSLSLAVAVVAASACSKDDPNSLLGTGSGGIAGCPVNTGTAGTGAEAGSGGNGGSTTSTTGMTTSTTTTTEKTVLDQRVLSYTEALRTASFKLVGNAPKLEDILAIQNAGSDTEQKKAYEAMIDAMMKDTRFKNRLVEFWRNTFRMAGPASGKKPSRDTAPTFAARIVFEGHPFTDLLTATTNTCPTFDGTDFKDGSCPANGPAGMETVGVFTDPGIHAQYYGNLAFRRVRFFQEVFACRKMPAEYNPQAKNPPPIAGCEMAQPYTNPWDFTKIGGHTNSGRIDFQDCSSVICANCHATINHRAPLFANFDENGMYQPQISVLLPITGTPPAVPTDYLVDGEGTAWKKDMPAADLAAMGQAMASDDEVLSCAVTRVWNYAMSKGDVVADSAALDPSIVDPLLKKFKASGFNLNATWREIFTHDDFVRY